MIQQIENANTQSPEQDNQDTFEQQQLTFEQEFDLACEKIENNQSAIDSQKENTDFHNVVNSSTQQDLKLDEQSRNARSTDKDDSSDTDYSGGEETDSEEDQQEISEPEKAKENKRSYKPRTTNKQVETQAQQELERQRAYYEQQLALAHSRLQNVSNEYQKTKAQLISSGQQGQHSHKESDVKNLFPDSKMPSLDEAKKILENDPEYAGAIMRLLQTHLEDTRTKINDEVKNQIFPVYQQLQLSEAQKTHQSIRKAHPDTDTILQSGELVKWIDSLPPMYRVGAQRVFTRGTAEESIALLTEFKNSTNYVNNTTNIKVDPNNANDVSNQSKTPTNGLPSTKSVIEKRKESDELVARLRDGLTVSSGRREPSIAQSQKSVSFEDEFNAAVESFEKQRRGFSRNGRR